MYNIIRRRQKGPKKALETGGEKKKIEKKPRVSQGEKENTGEERRSKAPPRTGEYLLGSKRVGC